MTTSNGDSTIQATVVAPNLATQQVASTSAAGSVNTIDATHSVQTIQQTQDVSGLISTYDRRIKDLQSMADKALFERNQAIAQANNIQSEYSSYHEQSKAALATSVNTAQQQIDRANQLESELNKQKGEALRAQALLAKPHLANFAQFIPASSNVDEVNAAVQKLDELYQSEISKHGQQTYQNQTPGLLPQQQQQQQPSPASILGLYQNRAAMGQPTLGTPGMIPGSTPAQLPGQMMQASTLQDPSSAIKQLFVEAKQSADPNAYNNALEKAKLLNDAYTKSMMGRSS